MQLEIKRNLTNLASLHISNAIMTAIIKTNTQTITMTLVKSIKENMQKKLRMLLLINYVKTCI